jgi:hypothetical protein
MAGVQLPEYLGKVKGQNSAPTNEPVKNDEAPHETLVPKKIKPKTQDS